VKLEGVVPPIVTPLSGGDVDREGLARLVERLIGGGVHGLFVLGTTGEGPSLSKAGKFTAAAETCRLARGRVPVLVGITDTSFAESLELARHAARHGAAALVLAPPYYLPPAQAELLEYLSHIAPQLPLPLFLYNMPSTTKVHMTLDTVQRAAELPNVAGMKDSSCNMVYFHELIQTFRGLEFPLFMGPEELLGEAVLYGGAGGVCGGANLAPRLYVAMFEAAKAGRCDRMRELQALMYELRGLYRVGQHSSSIIKGIKCALSLEGVCSDEMAEPFARFHPPERARVAAIWEQLKVRLAQV
jgi:4-hydroxy-tetrahydrodipicolinate synthase